MKNLVLFFVLMICLQVQSQEQQVGSENYTEVFKNNEVDVKAEPKGGIKLFYKDLINATELSDITTDKIDFKVSFVVEKDGSLTSFELLGDQNDYGKKVVNFLKTQPKWKPAYIKDSIVRSQMILPIRVHNNL